MIKKAINLQPEQEETANIQKMASAEFNPPKLSSFARSQNSLSLKNGDKPEISERDTMASMEKEDEDTVFNRFFVLCENDNTKNATEPQNDNLLFRKQKTNCLYKYLCCCLIKQEEDYYSHF